MRKKPKHEDTTVIVTSTTGLPYEMALSTYRALAAKYPVERK